MTDSTYKVLSVDPSRTPSGMANPEMALKFMRRRGVVRSAWERRNAGVAATVFGTSASRGGSVLILAARILVGTFLVIVGILSLCSDAMIQLPALLSVATAVAGVAFILGVFGRFVALAGALVCIGMMFSGLSVVLVALLASLVALSVSGPGKYSVDTLLQKKLKKHLMRSAQSGLDDYRAFSRL